MEARAPFVMRVKSGSLDARGLGLRLATARGAGGAVALRELVDAARGVHEALFACEERMAGGADADAEVLHRGACVINRAAGAGDGGLVGFGMDSFFHGSRM